MEPEKILVAFLAWTTIVVAIGYFAGCRIGKLEERDRCRNAKRHTPDGPDVYSEPTPTRKDRDE